MGLRSFWLGVLGALVAAPAVACGPDTDCVVGDRIYRLYVPEGDPPVGALYFAHGYRGSAAAVMKNTTLKEMLAERGWALIALDTAGDDWQLAHTPSAPDREKVPEFAYMSAVLRDVTERLPSIQREQTVMTGFSAGGMMTWTIACGMSDAVAGFVPMSGTFWAPVPRRCPTPAANLIHIHGETDRVVPLEGRAINEARQGSVPEALAMYRAHLGTTGTKRFFAGDMICDRDIHPEGRVFEFCLFDGGHSFSSARLFYAIDRVLAAPEPE